MGIKTRTAPTEIFFIYPKTLIFVLTRMICKIADTLIWAKIVAFLTTTHACETVSCVINVRTAATATTVIFVRIAKHARTANFVMTV